MNKNQKIIMWVGGIFLIPLCIAWLFYFTNYLSVKHHEQVIVSKALGAELKNDHRNVSDWSSQEQARYFEKMTKEDVARISQLQTEENKAMAWIALTGVLVCFGGGFAALAFFLAGIPRIK